jgi:hypothetical protein
MEVLGKVKLINDTQTFGSNGFRKRDCVVTTDEQYPQMILVEFIQDKCDLLNDFNIGDSVKININIRGREWINPQGEAKYFNSIQGWRIEKLQADATSETVPPVDTIDAFKPATETKEESADDLPF